MHILVRGTANSTTQNYADRILAALFTTSLTKYGKKTLILQTDSVHPVENVLLGREKKANAIRNEFTFTTNGMDAIWKNIRGGAMNADDWSDCCRNLSKQRQNGLDIADVSADATFTDRLVSEFETFENIVKSADQWYDVIFIFANGNNTELINKMRESKLDGGNFIDKEVVCVPQAPERLEEVEDNRYFAIKNFDFGSEFTLKEMSKFYGKRVYPVPYNIGFKDACLKEAALHYFSTNIKNEENDENYRFSECISTLMGALLGTEEKEDKTRNLAFRG